MTTSDQMQAAILPAANAAFSVGSVAKPVPGSNEVLVRGP